MSEARAYTLFGRISILVLAIQWIVFGSMHFSHMTETLAQLPDWLFPEPTQIPIVIITGVAEVAVGILILIPETRRAAAMGSLVLLVLLLPAMYNILETGVIPNPDIPGWLRTSLVPNNIFLAICSVYLWRNPHLGLADPDAAPASSPSPRWWRSGDMSTPMIAALLLMANCAGFVAAAWPSRDTGAAVLWAMASIAIGALIGFLFAVPRINPEVKVRSRLIPNANVEAVSDWLTKILVGVGLVNFQSIGAFINGLAGELARGTGRTHAYALGLIVYFLAVGVIQGYVLTRIFLTARFRAEMQDDLVG